MSYRLFAALFWVGAVANLVACADRAATPAAAPTVVLHSQAGPAPALIEIVGLSSAELAALGRLRAGSADWQSLLKVTVGDTVAEGLPPVQGRYTVTDSGLLFTPLYPFDPGRAYVVTFDPARLPRPRQLAVVSQVVRLPALARSPTTRVTAVYPAGAVLPENTLRLYIEFSAPMGNQGALDFVRLRDQRGRDVAIPFLPVQADFWNAEHTRYTLFFDPGRVKQGIRPNQELGRPLEAGREYTLDVSADWHDAQGQPLVTSFRRTFKVGAAETRQLSMASWRIAPPAANTREPLVVTFPGPLDHGLLARALGVELADGRSIDGNVVLGAGDGQWTFRPLTPWEAGEYRLTALSILEDPAGNRIGRAFEVDISKSSGEAPADSYRARFRIAAAGF